VTSLLRSVRLALIVVIFSSALVTQSQTGGTSSGLPDDSGSVGATPSDNSKPLPWKFLASPGGALDSTKWDAAIDALGHCEDPQKCGVPTSQVRDLVEATAGIDPTKTKATYVVIHVVDYGDNIVDHWYLYRSSKGNWGDPAWSYEKFSGQRIYGSTSVLFLFVHRNVPVLTLENGVRQLRDAPPIKALTDEERKGLSDKNLEDALRSNKLKIGESTEFTFCDETSGGQFQWFGNFGIPSAYANVRYESGYSAYLEVLDAQQAAKARHQRIGFGNDLVHLQGLRRTFTGLLLNAVELRPYMGEGGAQVMGNVV